MAMQTVASFKTSDKYIAITCILSGQSILEIGHEIDPRGKTRVFFVFNEPAREIAQAFKFSTVGEEKMLFDIRELQRVAKDITHIINDYRREHNI